MAKTGITVYDLLKQPLVRRKSEEQVRIVLEGKPRPPLNWSKINPTGSSLEFSEAIYDQVSWLTGCEMNHRFFCWPCLLFNKKIESWNRFGIAPSNTEALLGNLKKHEITEEHIQASLDLQVLITRSGDAVLLERKTDDQGHNGVVVKKIVTRLVNVILNGVVKRLPPPKGNKSNVLEIEDCLTMLQLQLNYEICSIEEIHSAIGAIKNNPNFLNSVVDAMTEVIINSVKQEIQVSTYVSLILSEHSDATNKSHISTVLRYLKDGKVCERFVGFVSLQELGSSNMYEHITSVLSEFRVSEKFLAYALDGSLSFSPLNGLQALLEEHQRCQLLVPWYAHELENILHQSLSSVTIYKLFFTTLTEIRNFIQEYSRRWTAFQRFRVEHAPSFTNQWFTQSEVISRMCTHRTRFIDFFDSMLQNSRSWEPEDITKASGFQQYLKEFNTVFFLHVFSKLFEVISPFITALKSNTPEEVFSHFNLQDLHDTLSKERNRGFRTVWNNVLKETGGKGPHTSERLSFRQSRSITCAYIKKFRAIVEHLKQEIGTRFKNFHLLEFICLLKHEHCAERKNVARLLDKLRLAEESLYEPEEIINEIEVLEKNVPRKESTEDLYAFFEEANLRHTFKSLHKLAELAMTLPNRKILNADGVSKLNKITSCTHIQNVGISGDVSVLWVELKYLQELRSNVSFYDQVIARFYEKNRGIELA